MLCKNNKFNEYYLGDLPGTLQYNKEQKYIIDSVNDCEYNELESGGFVFCSHSKENLNRIIPHTQKNKKWKIILIMKSSTDNEVWFKAAILNKENGRISLMTSTNKEENITKRGNRAIKSCDPQWFVGHYRMLAPIIFWDELKNRLEF
jgi:hypothetical protein